MKTANDIDDFGCQPPSRPLTVAVGDTQRVWDDSGAQRVATAIALDCGPAKPTSADSRPTPPWMRFILFREARGSGNDGSTIDGERPVEAGNAVSGYAAIGAERSDRQPAPTLNLVERAIAVTKSTSQTLCGLSRRNDDNSSGAA